MRNLQDVQTLTTFVSHLREGVYITTEAGRILDANPAFLAMFGVDGVDALAAYTAGSLVADPARRTEELRQLDRDGAVREFELEIVRPDGTTCTVLDTAYQVRDPETGERLYHGILVDITDRKRLERELIGLATRDPLTGCHNRRFLQEALRGIDDEPDRALGVIVIDLDGFKDVNDRLGHDAGDRVLAHMGRFLQAEVRIADPVIRLGGDEFLILLPDATQAIVDEVVGRLRRSGPDGAPASFSLGAAIREPREAGEAAIRRADQRMLRLRVATRRPYVGR